MTLNMSRICVIALTVFCIIGLTLLAVGIGLMSFLQTLVEREISKNLNLLNNTETFENWLKPPVPVYMSFNFFNVTNFAEFSKGAAKPVVEQVGPYVYREIRDKVEIKYSDDYETISYREQKFYIFDSTNVLKESDFIYTLNIPVLVISKLLQDKLPYFLLKMIGLFLNGEKLIEKRTVKEILWGYNMTLADYINKKLQDYGLSPIKFPTFGFYVDSKSNGSILDVYNISTGFGNVHEIGIIKSWAGHSQVSYWLEDRCNMINGTDGSFWPPFVNESQTLYLFSPDICRSIYMTYFSKGKVFDLNYLKFSVPETVFRDPAIEPSNRCFCVPDYNSCLKAGVLDISRCNEGAPVVVSLPHFLYGDAGYISAVDGLKPDVAMHQSYVNVEPLLGLALEAHKRLQINFVLQKYTAFDSTWFLTEPIIFPIVWAEESAVIDEATASKLYKMAYVPIVTGHALMYTFVVLGSIMFILAFVPLMYGLCRKEYDVKFIYNVPSLNLAANFIDRTLKPPITGMFHRKGLLYFKRPSADYDFI